MAANARMSKLLQNIATLTLAVDGLKRKECQWESRLNHNKSNLKYIASEIYNEELFQINHVENRSFEEYNKLSECF